MSAIASVAELEALYGLPNDNSTVKEIGYITKTYRQYIEAAPFAALATVGPEGLDCSPRGDAGQAVRVHDEKTVMLPDRRGNNRIDSLRNIVRDPRVALLFMVPGSNTTMRINGRAIVTVDESLLQSFEMEGKLPRSVVVINVETIYFQCARALMRAGLWTEEAKIDPETLPTPGAMLAETSNGRIGGDQYDREWPERAAATMW